MKQIIAFLLFLIVTKFYSQNNDILNLGFKGKIKTIDTYVDNIKTKSIHYNEDGNILYYAMGINLNAKGEKSYYTNKYDNFGRKIATIDASFTTIKKYNDSENSILECTLLNLKKDTTHLYFTQFDNNKNLIIDRNIEYSYGRRFREVTSEYQYDTLNRLTKKVYMFKNLETNSIKPYIIYKMYSYYKDIIKEVIINHKGEESVTEDFKFPSKPLAYKNYFTYFSSVSDSLVYDNKTESTKVIKYTDKEKSSKKVLTFSKSELILSEEEYENGKLIFKIENKYDNNDNVIEKVVINYKKRKTDIIKNIITYYN